MVLTLIAAVSVAIGCGANASPRPQRDAALPKRALHPCGKATSAAPRRYDHVVWIVMENKSYKDLLGSSRFMRSLGRGVRGGHQLPRRVPSEPSQLHRHDLGLHARREGRRQPLGPPAQGAEHLLPARQPLAGTAGVDAAQLRPHAIGAVRAQAQPGGVLHGYRPCLRQAGREAHWQARHLRPLHLHHAQPLPRQPQLRGEHRRPLSRGSRAEDRRQPRSTGPGRRRSSSPTTRTTAARPTTSPRS